MRERCRRSELAIVGVSDHDEPSRRTKRGDGSRITGGGSSVTRPT
jgi:hypothetical protein